MASSALQKSLGAFYTDEPAADRLTQWAVRDRDALVFDPSCGDGVFLAASFGHLLSLGSKRPKVYGLDISNEAIRSAGARISSAELIQGDFFDFAPESMPAFDCIVGNPPYIRYQTFNVDRESKGHLRAREAGVPLPRLASSWAPFVVHATRFLRPGGRLAMVMPTEIGHAFYARAVLRYLVEHFGRIDIEAFRNNLFEDLSQSTVLLFCDGFGEACRRFTVKFSSGLRTGGGLSSRVDVESVRRGTFRLAHYLIPEDVRSLYASLTDTPHVQRLRDVADVGIGYVTGANDYFHLTEPERQQIGIDSRFLRPAALNLRGVGSVSYLRRDWVAKQEAGEKVHLMELPSVPKNLLPAAVQRYLHQGEVTGVADRYKCRIRKFWYAIPNVRVADAFLSYLSSEMPSLLVNSAGLVAPNTVHLLRFADGCDPAVYAAAWRNSLTKLSCELEGHALGGGVLKLEPSEAGNVLVINSQAARSRALSEKGPQIGKKSGDRILDFSDRALLQEQIGLSRPECISLREAAMTIEQWRKHQ